VASYDSSVSLLLKPLNNGDGGTRSYVRLRRYFVYELRSRNTCLYKDPCTVPWRPRQC